MNVEVDDIQTKEADDRGRLYLGTEYANRRVTVAVVAVEDDRPDEAALAAAYRDASESAGDIAHDWEHASEGTWDSLGSAPAVDGYDPDLDE